MGELYKGPQICVRILISGSSIRRLLFVGKSFPHDCYMWVSHCGSLSSLSLFRVGHLEGVDGRRSTGTFSRCVFREITPQRYSCFDPYDRFDRINRLTGDLNRTQTGWSFTPFSSLNIMSLPPGVYEGLLSCPVPHQGHLLTPNTSKKSSPRLVEGPSK